MTTEFQRVAIVNRGEPAMRFIHAVREFNEERGTTISTVALFTDPDRKAMYIREADEAISLGAAQSIDPVTHLARSSYVDYERLERALSAARADAVWVGWGFAAEHAGFADLCRDLGIVFIGPDGEVMRRLGDKISSKLLAEEAGIPVVPWSGGPVESLADAYGHGERLGYPLLVKATAGGGGHGIRRASSARELPLAFESARADAFKAFGNPTVFMEQVVEAARHVEVQIIADHYGTTWAVGVRDCSIQRRHQKVLEEAPSPILSLAEDRDLREAAIRLSQASGYHNAGTVEFLFEPSSRRISFMEMNTRLQVEHPVTECTTGLDLVKMQIYIALGGRLEGDAPATVGHAVEVRLNAEDPDNNFAPAPGMIERFRIQPGPGVRVDAGISEGDVVPKEFDSMIAKIIAYGRDRSEALARLQRALHDSVVVIRGGTSNKAFLTELLSLPEVKTGEADVSWLDGLARRNAHIYRRYAEMALVHAAIEVYDDALAVEQKQFFASAVRGRPQVRSEVGRCVELRYQGNPYSLKVYRLGPLQYRVEADGARIDVQIERPSPFESWVTAFGRRFHVVSVNQGLHCRIEVDGIQHRVDREDGGVVHAPAPAVVVSIAVKAGDTVSAGQRLAVLEAMKMEMQVVAPFSGKVRHILTIPNVQVDTGTPLMQIEPDDSDTLVQLPCRVMFHRPGTEDAGAQVSSLQSLEELRQLILGFDVEPSHATRTVAEWRKTRGALAASAEIRNRENELLEIFADICSLFNSEREQDGATGAEAPTSEAYLFSYLRLIDTAGEGLPASFVDALRRALAHYGIATLDRSPELEESLFRIDKSHQRMELHIAPVLAVLESRLEDLETGPPQAGESFRVLLDRIVSVTRGTYQRVSDLATEVRYRYFDQPLFEHARNQVYAQVEEQLAYVEAHPDAPDRRDRVRIVSECPQPLAGLFTNRFPGANTGLHRFLLEVLTARYYRIRNLLSSHYIEQGGHFYLTAAYDHEGKRIHVFTAFAEYQALVEAVRAIAPLLEAVPAEHDIVIDFYVRRNGEPSGAETIQKEIHRLLNLSSFPRVVRRVVVVVTGQGRGYGRGGVEHFTYRPSATGYEEEKLYRGVHPMVAKRLHLWRLTNFHIDRLPSVEDVYVIHAVARDNPKDERLFVCAEVRDLTPVRNEKGDIVALPHLERMLAEALASIRFYQSRRPTHERLYWNRVLLYMWPPVYLKPNELNEIVKKLAPATEGLGLEQVVVRARILNPETSELRDMVVRISSPGGTGICMTIRPATQPQPLRTLSDYEQKVVRMRQRGFIYPYEIIKLLTPPPEETRAGFPEGTFVEYDLDAQGRIAPVDRPYGQNRANIIVGVIHNYTTRYPEGMKRVLMLGDPSKGLGAIAEPECRRVIAALDLAEREGVPLEWFAISSGAKISMDSGVENMDWIAAVLRRLIEFTQAGGEVNLIIDGINVGAQPYWNAEATMLMHTRGILVMTPRAAMVLTGKRALDYSGSVSAEDNQGIGGYDRIMGPNGQAQYRAQDIGDACQILLRHYEHTYLAPGERFPRRAITTDPIDRDVRQYAHNHQNGGLKGFGSVGEIFADETNPGRKKSFDIRQVMMAVVDQDHAPLERWHGMRSADTTVVWDAHLGGYPVCLIGIESKPVPRMGFVPADGPDQWSAGTLFPQSSKKVARAINAASRNRPVVILANLSGFDGSPESMRNLQLEYGAQIGRAVVNFEGPMIFCVISRYHGGAYVVFSQRLNEQLEVVALEGTYASVIGGAPAAAVVFAGEVEARTRKDPRYQALQQSMSQAETVEKGRLRSQLDELFKVIYSEKLGQIAEEFDSVHTVHRALRVGALRAIIPPATLRPYLIQAVERATTAGQRLEQAYAHA